jgi:hypothetical protein
MCAQRLAHGRAVHACPLCSLSLNPAGSGDGDGGLHHARRARPVLCGHVMHAAAPPACPAPSMPARDPARLPAARRPPRPRRGRQVTAPVDSTTGGVPGPNFWGA